MKKLYLSGPMTGVPDLNRPAFNAAAKALRSAGYAVVNPPELDRNEPRTTWKECLQRDIRHMMLCGAVATLPNWTKSRGANLEIYVGKKLSYPVHTVGYWLKNAEMELKKVRK